MDVVPKALLLLACAALSALGCSPDADDSAELVEIARLPVDSLSAVVGRSQVEFDPKVSADGQGSLRASVTVPTVIALYEMGEMSIEGAELLYRAKVRTEGVDGRVYLEMWCHFPGRGDFFARAPESGSSGTTEWKTLEASFRIDRGRRPDNVRLNLVIDGSGTAWIDDIRLMRSPP